MDKVGVQEVWRQKCLRNRKQEGNQVPGTSCLEASDNEGVRQEDKEGTSHSSRGPKQTALH